MTEKSNSTLNNGAPKVTAHNYVRAESDLQMNLYIDRDDCFGRFVHSRKPYDVNNQQIGRASCRERV